MNNQHLLFIIQGDWYVEKLLIPLLLAIATGIVTYFVSRPKTKSEIGKVESEAGKLNAETISSFTKTIKEIQDTNQELFEKIQVLRAKQHEADDLLQSTKDELERCKERDNDCVDCADLLEKTLETLNEIESELKVLEGTKALSEKVANLTHKLKRQVEKLNEVDV